VTATNHAVTGAVITYAMASVGLAWLTLPVAFLSHFGLDALPHYDDKNGLEDNARIAGQKFKRLLKVDALACIGLVIIITIIHPAYWWLICLGAFAATAPDLMWLPKFLRALKGQPEQPNRRWYEKFHSWIQWCTGNNGKYVEAVWLGGMAGLLFYLII